MNNCARWTYQGETYEACDFGKFLLVHLPATIAAKPIRIDHDTQWKVSAERDVTRFRLATSTRTLEVLAPQPVDTVIRRWLTRVTKGPRLELNAM